MKLSQHGDFSEELKARAQGALSFRYSEPTEESYDFARCQRADGSFYGTAGQCRLGSAAEARAEVEKLTKRIARQEKAVQRLSGMTGVTRREVEVERNELKELKAKLTEAKRIQRSGPAQPKESGGSRPKAAIEADMKKLTSSGAMQQKGLAGVRARAEHAKLKSELAGAGASKAKRPLAEISAGAAEMYIRSGQRQLEDAKAANDRAGMMKAMRMIKTAQKQLAEAKKRDAADAAKVRPFPAPKQPSVKGVGSAEQRMVMKRLEERLDSAVTVNEQQRISNAIRELQGRMS